MIDPMTSQEWNLFVRVIQELIECCKPSLPRREFARPGRMSSSLARLQGSYARPVHHRLRLTLPLPLSRLPIKSRPAWASGEGRRR